MVTYYYRFEDRAEGDGYSSWTQVYLRKLIVIKRTPKGVKLIGLGYGRENPRFVLNDSRKKFACPTIDEAKASYQKRKNRQIRIYEARAAFAREAHDQCLLGEYKTGIDWNHPDALDEPPTPRA